MPVYNLSDIEAAAKQFIDKMTGDFWSGGANELLTVSENVSAYGDYRIRPRYMRDVAVVSTTAKNKLFGKEFAIPCGIAPSSFHKLAHADGELATGAAAKSRNWPMAISSYSSYSLEDVSKVSGDNLLFFQLYVFKNRDTSTDLVRRAEAAGFKAILVTIDSPFLGLRFSERQNKFTLPRGILAANFAGGRYAGPIDVSIDHKSESKGPGANKSLFEGPKPNVIDPGLTWEDIKWLKSITTLEVWVKGVLTSEDAEDAIQAGASGIWVSNHGGRQLDGCLPTLHALPEVVKAVNGRIPVHLDGGIRKGSDIFRALALGADFVWIGRPILWGLKYNGQEGLETVERLLEEEFKLVLALSGCTSPSEITKGHLTKRPGSTWSKL
ncbi:FMN-dependent dehydrogenase [Lipomyces japonicus]|uniref:FMN-dependent dehydrogenase n=1 Tax=Lipomyces japonicus TaxID=56871 RepID=UPI0034CF57AA